MTKHPEAGPRPARAWGRPAPAQHPARDKRKNLSDLAYGQVEELIVTCVLRPGQFLSIQDLQARTGVGRTPMHQAVSRLASDTLIRIRPRHGIQIAPINLQRERTLLRLRGDMERFVVHLAAERASATCRKALATIADALRSRGSRMDIGEFNALDQQINRLLIVAAAEPFLDATLRPLHTIFRRIGWIYHSRVRPNDLGGTVQGHLAIVESVAAGRLADAVVACDGLITFVKGMFDILDQDNDPSLFDCNLGLLPAYQAEPHPDLKASA